MKNSKQKTVVKQKNTKISKATWMFLGVILFISLCFFSASYFFNESILRAEFVLFDLFISAIPYFIVSVIFWVMHPIKTWKKPFVIVATTLLGAFLGFLLVISTMYIPGSRNLAYVEAEICAPAVTKHYGVKNITDLPTSHPAFDLGQTFYRWYAQHSECVDNFYKGRGPIFSENPPGFAPVQATFQISQPRNKIIEYKAENTDSLQSIANKFNVSKDTIKWENGLSADNVYQGQVFRILPITGASHKVAEGDTIYSLAKKYKTDPQKIADYPYNKFADNERLTLIPGEILIIPDGMK